MLNKQNFPHILLSLLLSGTFSIAQEFSSSNLPIVIVDSDIEEIPDEPKVIARMSIIDNGPGSRNNVSDPKNGYDGWIGIEVRGSSSQSWPKKQFGLETRDAAGEEVNVSLLGMPEENDWILYAPYIDRSLTRNALIYGLSREMGQYAPRTRFVELVLNGSYWGVYVLMEEIKRDKNRVDIADLNPDENTGDDLTGGYILSIDKPKNEYFISFYPPPGNTEKEIRYQYEDPKGGEITEPQKEYIQNFIHEFEETMAGPYMADPVAGYAKYIDVQSFVDFFILNEISKNVDGYRWSTFLHKQKDSDGGKLRMGPIWDFNLAFGNANYYAAEDWEGWQAVLLRETAGSDDGHVPFWWFVLMADTLFIEKTTQRWQSLRQNILSTSNIHNYIDAVADTLSEAQQRNFAIWVKPGEQGEGFWPVPGLFYSFRTYQDEVDYLKLWIENRLDWMHRNVHLLGRSASVHSNVAANRPVTASSVEAEGLNAELAVDRDPGTRWSSDFRDDQWIYVDLGMIHLIERIVLNWETAFGREYRIEVSYDTRNWREIFSTKDGNGGLDEIDGLSAEGRYVRMYGVLRGTEWGFSLWELEVYATAVTTFADRFVPGTFSLLQNFPNPFNPRTEILYQLPVASDVILELFDVRGRLVRTLVNEFESAGVKRVLFDGAEQPGGLYFYRLTAGGFTAVRRMVLLR